MICDSVELSDCSETKNIFTTVLQPCFKGKRASALNLMFEADILMRKDEAPKVSVVLMNSRILLFFKFLNNTLSYFLLNTDFLPPKEGSLRHAHLRFAKEGIILRNFHPEALPDNRIVLKITVKECDLVLIEDPESSNSLALFSSTTAVMNMTGGGGETSAALEIQQLNFSWCHMSAPSETACRLTNDFTTTVELSMDRSGRATLTECAKAFVAGLPNIAVPKHQLLLQVNNFIGRMSFKDAMIVKSVVTKAFEHYQKSLREPPLFVTTAYSEPPAINILRIILKANQMSMSVLDDYKEKSLPLARFILSALSVDYGNSAWNSSFDFAMDYFNQQLFKWEPFLEKWTIQTFNGKIVNRLVSIELKTRPDSTFEINVTQAFIQQFLRYSSRWDDIRRNLDSDLHAESICNARSDHLPYPNTEVPLEPLNFEVTVSMPSGIGLLLINGNYEELLYARLHGISLHAMVTQSTYRLTSSVNVIQVDNQLTTSDRWQFVFCHMNALNDEVDPPLHDGSKKRIDEWSESALVPALRIEMSCTPNPHYDAFECFRVKLCNVHPAGRDAPMETGRIHPGIRGDEQPPHGFDAPTAEYGTRASGSVESPKMLLWNAGFGDGLRCSICGDSREQRVKSGTPHTEAAVQCEAGQLRERVDHDASVSAAALLRNLLVPRRNAAEILHGGAAEANRQHSYHDGRVWQPARIGQRH
ncbi:hypothetical protein L596_024914 [Steinernema carpocapsae]|uniref:Uncharacterized protein n=1 Tax=Steinernema carpocapsae TaxID=34508 RepID=A0A4U5M684_STECR|nr:hypothetical protein L596_024914 [Steinernema carpocapsae]